jgi:hypothetical protein
MRPKTTPLFGMAFLSACGGDLGPSGGTADAGGHANLEVDSGNGSDASLEASSPLVEASTPLLDASGDAAAACLSCGEARRCGYLIADGCSAVGQCVGMMFCNELPTCAPVIPPGYAAAPVNPADGGTCR